MPNRADERCPCGHPMPYADCCGPAHRGSSPSTAEALMRSRYSAFARGDAGYLHRSWHPDTRPAAVTVDPDTRWIGLDVLESTGGGLFDTDGVVEFRARYRDRRGPGEVHERSRFVRHDGSWVYHGAI
jgi:SEC-C motif domain protein